MEKTKKESISKTSSMKPERLIPQQMEVTISQEKPKKKPSLHYLREKDRKIVTGKFINHETPGGSIDFCFRKYKGDKVERYQFEDGRVYRVPRGVALHIHNDCWYPVHEYRLDDQGNPCQMIGAKKKRFSFEPLDFEVDPEFNKNDVPIYTARTIS